MARDNLTQVLKCHVFRCDSPAKNIATSLHEMCSKVSHCWITFDVTPSSGGFMHNKKLHTSYLFFLPADNDGEKGIKARAEQAQP